ncbi:MAG: DUF2341 domain-containing protein, partial [bacterium]
MAQVSEGRSSDQPPADWSVYSSFNSSPPPFLLRMILLSLFLSLSFSGFGQTADFTADKTEICIGESVRFEATGGATSWEWDFGAGADPASATDQEVTVTYNSSGSKKISLTIDGGNDTETKYITVKPSPFATFGYSWEKEITINSGQVSGNTNLEDFPLLINIIDEDLKHSTGGVEHPGGYDIIFTQSDYTPLHHEIEHYDPATGEFIAWVRIPELLAQTDTQIKILYGNPAIENNPSSPDTWSPDYIGVWHLHNNNYRDGTNNNYDGTAYGVINKPAAIAEGGDFGPDNSDRIELGGFDVEGNALTISAWINDRAINDDSRIISKANGTPAASHWWMLGVNNSGRLRFRLRTNNNTTTLESSGAITGNTSLYVNAIYDGANMYIFQNGSEVRFTPKTGNINIDPDINVAIGNQPDGSGIRRFDGILDEVRVIKAARSADWIATEYNNQSDPGSFYTIGNATSNQWHIFEVCEGDTLEYQTGEIVGTSYLWEVTGGEIIDGIVNTSTVKVDWNNAGGGDPTLKLTTTLDGCSSETISFPVTIHSLPIPDISGPDLVCPEAAGISYEVDDIAGNSYSWDIDGGTIISGNVTNQITVDWGTQNPDAWVSISQTNENSCIAYDTLDVTVEDNQNPVINCPV